MSLIHKSLEQLRKQQSGQSLRHLTYPEKKRGLSRFTLFLLGVLLLLSLAAGGFLYFQNDFLEMIAGDRTQSKAGQSGEDAAIRLDSLEAHTSLRAETEFVQPSDEAPIPLTEEPSMPLGQSSTASGQFPQVLEPGYPTASGLTEALASDSVLSAIPAENTLAPGPAQAYESPPEAVLAKKQPLPGTLTEPVPSLERHFAEQAKRNNSIINLERRVQGAMAAGETDAARQLLRQLTDALGGDSLTVFKWSGYLALLEDSPAEAEGWFRQALAQAPAQADISYNLALALLHQDKIEEASTILARALQKYPGNETLKSLLLAIKNDYHYKVFAETDDN